MRSLRVVYEDNVCFKKIWTNHSSDTVLRFVQVFFETDVTTTSDLTTQSISALRLYLYSLLILLHYRF